MSDLPSKIQSSERQQDLNKRETSSVSNVKLSQKSVIGGVYAQQQLVIGEDWGASRSFENNQGQGLQVELGLKE